MTQTDNELAKRIAQLVEYKTNGQQVAFANLMGFSKQYLTKLLRGESIGLNTISTILRALPEVNARWLIFGEGNMVEAATMVRAIRTWVDYERYIQVMTAEDIREIQAGGLPSEKDVTRWEAALGERLERVENRIRRAMQKGSETTKNRK